MIFQTFLLDGRRRLGYHPARFLSEGGRAVDMRTRSVAWAALVVLTGCAELTAVQQQSSGLVASPPTVTPAHRRQQQSLGALLMRQFGTAERFKYIDLGGSIDLGDRTSSPDGVHRTELGNHEVAQRIATSLLRWSAFPGRRSR